MAKSARPDRGKLDSISMQRIKWTIATKEGETIDADKGIKSYEETVI